MSVGYAAFQTNLNITAKGNLKIIMNTVNFKTPLLDNTKFENLDLWQKGGCDSGSYEIDTEHKYNGYNSLKIQENGGGIYCWNGTYQLLNPRNFDVTKKYEVSFYAYRDSEGPSDLNNYLRVYVSMDKRWLYFEEYKSMQISLTKTTLPDKTWTKFTATSIRPETDGTVIKSFLMDYNGNVAREETSTVWIALPSLYEVETKEYRKYSKIGILPVATKEGYEFVGWYTDEFAGEKIDENYEIKDDIDLFARFIKS